MGLFSPKIKVEQLEGLFTQLQEQIVENGKLRTQLQLEIENKNQLNNEFSKQIKENDDLKNKLNIQKEKTSQISENYDKLISEYEIPVRFTQGIVDEDSLSFTKIPYIDVQPNPDYKFPDEKSAYDKLISVHDYENRAFSSENYIIEEIPID